MLRLEEEDIYAGIATSGGGGGDTPESAKGSFNASTQMLTFNNSYLVEKVNGSIASQAQKDAILQELGDNDVVINMNVDHAEGLPVTLNSWLLGDGKDTPIGAMIVSKTNPVTIKFLFTGDSGLMFLDWSAFAEYLSLQGTTITPEQAEEQYGAYVVDENVCTVSGTLGNFEVEFIEDTPVVEKYGATISNFLGDVDVNGVLQAPSGTVRNLSFDGIKGIYSNTSGSNVNALYSFYYKFAGCQNIGDVTFPDLINCRMMCFSHAFANSSITSLSMPKFTNFTSGTNNDGYICQGCESLKSVAFPSVVSSSTTYYNSSWFYSAFYSCTALETVDFSGLESITEYGQSFFASAFQKCTSLKQAIIFPKLKVIKTQAFSSAFGGAGLEEQTFPVLDTLWDRGLQYAFQYCSSLRNLSFPALKSDSFSTYTNVFNSMLSGVTGCTVHFPSNLQSVIGSWSDVTAGFGGTNTTVLFDLPATE